MEKKTKLVSRTGLRKKWARTRDRETLRRNKILGRGLKGNARKTGKEALERRTMQPKEQRRKKTAQKIYLVKTEGQITATERKGKSVNLLGRRERGQRYESGKGDEPGKIDLDRRRAR